MCALFIFNQLHMFSKHLTVDSLGDHEIIRYLKADIIGGYKF